jgi:anti-sigma B factor antagonist
LDIELRSLGQVKLIKLRGRLNLGDSVDRLRETLDDLIANGDTRILLELSEVPWIDSSGIGLLVKALTSAKQRGGSMKLLNPSKFTVQTLKMIALLDVFEIYVDQQEAVASFGESSFFLDQALTSVKSSGLRDPGVLQIPGFLRFSWNTVLH